MSRWSRILCVLWSAALAIGACPPAVASTSSQGDEKHAFSSHLMLAQNAERQSLGLRRLRWDPKLEAAASAYADALAATGRWQHSPIEARPGQGENLWMGTHGAFTPEQMINGWMSEKKMFRAGTFPDVSSTGHWEDVGHYTQVIWAATDRVGCSLRSSLKYDYLVCRYSRPGNVLGENVMPTRIATAG